MFFGTFAFQVPRVVMNLAIKDFRKHTGQCLMLIFCHLILIHSGLSLNINLALNDGVNVVESNRLNVGGYDIRSSAHMLLRQYAHDSSKFETVKFGQPDIDAVETEHSESSVAERKMTGGRGGLGFFGEGLSERRERVSRRRSHYYPYVPSNYTGPELKNGKVTLEFMKTLMEYIRNKSIEEPPMQEKYASTILQEIKKYYKAQPSLIEIKVPDLYNVTVVGDIHGQVDSLFHIFKLSGLPSEHNRYLFNGDFVDTGNYSSECALVIFGFKLLYPDAVFINRGNHEDQNRNRGSGFMEECSVIYNMELYKKFSAAFQWLPLAHLINKKVLVLHGGLFKQKGVTLDDIKKIERGQDPDEKKSPLMFNILWSDPGKKEGRKYNTQRWGGIACGPDVTKSFCSRNHLDYIIRSHEPKMEGYEVEHNSQMITIFSAAYYFSEKGVPNKGAIMKLQAPELKQNIITFTTDDVNQSWECFYPVSGPQSMFKRILKCAGSFFS